MVSFSMVFHPAVVSIRTEARVAQISEAWLVAVKQVIETVKPRSSLSVHGGSGVSHEMQPPPPLYDDLRRELLKLSLKRRRVFEKKVVRRRRS
jgi:hypothetical protein